MPAAARAGGGEFASFQAYFAWIAAHRTMARHCFIKAGIGQIEILGKAGILGAIIGRSKFLLIERSDKLAQAISLALAIGTGRFASWMEATRSPEEVAFPLAQIDAMIGGIARNQHDFDLFFARNGIVPVTVIYEHLIADPQHQLSAVMRRLGLPDVTLDKDQLRLERQAGPVNAEWRATYLAAERGSAG